MSQTLTSQDAELDLSDIHPAVVFWRMMDLQPAPRLFRRERLVERSRDMCIEVITDQDYLLYIRIVYVEEMLYLASPTFLGSGF